MGEDFGKGGDEDGEGEPEEGKTDGDGSVRIGEWIESGMEIESGPVVGGDEEDGEGGDDNADGEEDGIVGIDAVSEHYLDTCLWLRTLGRVALKIASEDEEDEESEEDGEDEVGADCDAMDNTGDGVVGNGGGEHLVFGNPDHLDGWNGGRVCKTAGTDLHPDGACAIGRDDLKTSYGELLTADEVHGRETVDGDNRILALDGNAVDGNAEIISYAIVALGMDGGGNGEEGEEENEECLIH